MIIRDRTDDLCAPNDIQLRIWWSEFTVLPLRAADSHLEMQKTSYISTCRYMLPLSRHSFVRATHRRLQEAHDGSNTAECRHKTARRTTRSRCIMQRIRNGTAMPLDVKFGTVTSRAATTEGQEYYVNSEVAFLSLQ